MTRHVVDSGQKWLGSIPSTWTTAPLGRVFRERRTTVSDQDFEPLSVSMAGIVPRMENVALTASGDSRKLVMAGDYVINSRSDRKGSGGLAEQDGSVSLISTVLRPTGIEPRFSHHLLRSTAFQEEYYRWGSGIVADLWSTRFDKMSKILLPLPPRAEQQAIADYLDRETAKIDALIEKQSIMIDGLRERRAAVIERAVADPTLPRKPLGSTTSLLQTGPFGSQLAADEYVQDGVPILNPQHLVGGVIRPESSVTVSDATAARLNRHSLRLGDLVAARRGELGRSAVVTQREEGWLVGTGSLLVRPDCRVWDSRFLQMAFSSRQTSEVLSLMAVGSTMSNVNTSMVARLRLPCPSRREQSEIADRLDRETAKMDALIGKAERFIKLARERRAALITAAVTGQIDVTEGAA